MSYTYDMVLEYCNDGQCSTIREGESHQVSMDTCYKNAHTIKKIDRVFVSLSLVFLIIGVGVYAIFITVEVANDLRLERVCINNAIFSIESEEERKRTYINCLDETIDTIRYQLFSLVVITLSSIFAHQGRFRYYRAIPK